MSLIVYKTAPDRDCYVLWRTSSDSPVFIGDRAKTAARLRPECGHPSLAEQKLALADQTGSSHIDGEGGWDHEGVAAGGGCFPDGEMRFVPRSNLEAFVRAADAGDVERMLSLATEMQESHGSVGGGF
ncbi:hypothetical protein [Nonomuraea wenchangensis]|uniref:Uncharacterized protein n=1 Tax=Nonomuraea wenchangensis TaxID=568860 RepID=A0A1I0LTT0_9ACTN|nr:hypothetical protein [Nonomuraea wenchangensis]SEU46529.1 hypothetical protein SAMN05421811_12767 [Nonomuraea wenchangensis]